MSRLLVAQRALTVPGWAKDELSRKAQSIPSLDLRFAESKSLVDATTGSNLVTFTRASSGTFVGSDGLIKTATTNLLLRSEEFDNAYWGAIGGTVSSDGATAPNGANTADIFTENSGSNDPRLPVNVTMTAGASYTLSVYAKVKPGSAQRYLTLVFNAGFSSVVGANFNLVTGAVGATNSAVGSMQALGGGWYRCSMTPSGTATGNGSFRIRLASVDTSGNITSPSAYTGDGTSGIYLWGAQLEQSSTVGEYIPTTSAINSAPRFDHNPTTGESLGLLVEEARTNLNTNSEDFTGYGASAGSVTGNQGTAPDGAVTADQIASTGGGLFKSISGTTASTVYTATVYAKYVSGGALLSFGFDANPSSGRADFNLQTGALGPGIGANVTSRSITALPNGWYRCSVTATVTSTSTIIAFYNATSGSNFLVWGAQLEAGAFPTSYIPTTTATVTRSADVASDTTRGGNIRSLFTSFRSPASGTRPVVSLDDNTANERIEILTSGTDPKLLVTDGGSAVADLDAGTVTANTTARIAARFQTDDYGVSIDSATPQLDVAGTLPTATRVRIGSNQAGGYLNGTIARIAGWDIALPLLPPVSG